MKTRTTFTVKKLGNEFAVISPSGNVHSILSTLAAATELAYRINETGEQQRRESRRY